jgi:NAD-dependent deacetylase
VEIDAGNVALLDKAAARITAARAVAVLTGAGVSAASGVPTFRGPEGLWRRFRPEELATPQAFARDPRLVWEWYDWRRRVIANCVPNAAHEVLARWARDVPACTVITQNVDGLHERAGLPGVVRLHGSIWEVSCWARCPLAPSRWRNETVPLPALPPRCPHCGGLLRPAVVWFGEALPIEALDRAEAAAAACDVFVAAGTSAIVHPAAGLVWTARARGAFTIEINPAETEASPEIDLALRLPAEAALAQLDARLRQGTSTAAP